MDKAAQKVIKGLKSADDNEKFAALVYIPKIWESPQSLQDSPYSQEVWKALRSTQFIERSLTSSEVRPLIYSILLIFSHIAPPQDLILLIPHIYSHIDEKDASALIVEIGQCLDDISPLFEFIPLSLQTLSLFTSATQGAKKCSLTNPVYLARENLFQLLTGCEDLEIRKNIFILFSNLLRSTNSIIGFHASSSKLEFSNFFAILRLAFIELRLQLDVPLNYKEIEENEKLQRELEKSKKAQYPRNHKPENEDYYFDQNNDDDDDEFIDYSMVDQMEDPKKQKSKKSTNSAQSSQPPEDKAKEAGKTEKAEKIDPKKVKFTQNIGSLLNPELSAAACGILEFLVVPLLDHEEEFSDEQVSEYFKQINEIIKEFCLIINAAQGDRDKDRQELHAVLALLANWLREAPFLCQNKDIMNSLKPLMLLLFYFPQEAILFIPAFEEWYKTKEKQTLKVNGFSQLADIMKTVASPEEKEEIDAFIKLLYK